MNCDHINQEYRKHKCIDGSYQIKLQCTYCGYSNRKAIKKTSTICIELLSEFNIEASDKYRIEQYQNNIEKDLAEKINGVDLDFKVIEKNYKNQSSFYEKYIMSNEWKAIRNQVLNRDNNLCQGCLACKATEVHHKTYKRLGNELLLDLISVCRNCHIRLHPTYHHSDEE